MKAALNVQTLPASSKNSGCYFENRRILKSFSSHDELKACSFCLLGAPRDKASMRGCGWRDLQEQHTRSITLLGLELWSYYLPRSSAAPFLQVHFPHGSLDFPRCLSLSQIPNPPSSSRPTRHGAPQGPLPGGTPPRVSLKQSPGGNPASYTQKSC